MFLMREILNFDVVKEKERHRKTYRVYCFCGTGFLADLTLKVVHVFRDVTHVIVTSA